MENKMSVTDQFLDKYKQLEAEIDLKYGETAKAKNDTAVAFLENRPEYRLYKNGLQWCREIRNLLSHKSKVMGEYPIEPSIQMIKFMDEIILKVHSRLTCMQIGIPFSNMYCRALGDNLLDTVKEMRYKAYTYVPIVDGKKVIGIFDENSLFCYVADNGIVDLEDLTFEDLKDYIGLDGREMEVFVFHNKKTYIDDLKEEFQRKFDENKRIGVVFITENGRRNEAVSCMLTAWDLIGR